MAAPPGRRRQSDQRRGRTPSPLAAQFSEGQVEQHLHGPQRAASGRIEAAGSPYPVTWFPGGHAMLPHIASRGQTGEELLAALLLPLGSLETVQSSQKQHPENQDDSSSGTTGGSSAAVLFLLHKGSNLSRDPRPNWSKLYYIVITAVFIKSERLNH